MTGQNLSKHSDCVTCGGDGMVVVSHRMPEKTLYQIERKIDWKPHPSERGYEECAPCPVCAISGWWAGKTWSYGKLPGEVVVT